MPFRNFTPFEKLTAAQVNNFLMSQAVARFEDSTERDSQISSPVEGQLIFLESDGYQSYDGTAWQAFSAGGATWDTWTPSFGLGFDAGSGNIIARYIVIDKLLYGFIHVELGSGFDVGSGMGFSLPEPVSANLDPTNYTLTVGTGSLIDISAAGRYLAFPLFLDPVNIFMRRIDNEGKQASLSSSEPFTWAVGDQLSCQFQYEVD